MKQPCASAARLRGADPFRRRHQSHGPGRVTTPSDRYRQLATRGQPAPKPCFHVLLLPPALGMSLPLLGLSARSGGQPRHDALRDLAGRDHAPRPDEPLASKRHNHFRLAGAGLDSCAIPLHERTVLLEQEEPPRELDQAAAHAGVAGFSQPLLASLGAALRRRARNPGVSGHASRARRRARRAGSWRGSPAPACPRSRCRHQ